MIRYLYLLMIAAPLVSCAVAGKPAMPASGEYTFAHRFAEHPDIRSIDVIAELQGTEIKISNRARSSALPLGLLEEGRLLWHARTRQWIIGKNEADVDAAEVGGCSGGPSVIDFRERIYWTC